MHIYINCYECLIKVDDRGMIATSFSSTKFHIEIFKRKVLKKKIKFFLIKRMNGIWREKNK